MTLTREQFDQLSGTYAKHVVEGMDIDSLVEFAYETIVENLEDASDETLLERLFSYYEEYEVVSMLEDVGANPTEFDIPTNGDELTEEQQKQLRDLVKPTDT
jgi:hypothetical protein